MRIRHLLAAVVVGWTAYLIGQADGRQHGAASACIAPKPAPAKALLSTAERGEICTAWWFGNDNPAHKADTARRLCGRK